MSKIIYSKLGGQNDAMYGKIDTPVKMLIENESNQCEKEGGVTRELYNVEKSSRFGETIIGQSDFDTFQAALEGAGAENDGIQQTYKKFIEHIQFMKEFTITAEAVEDAKYGIALETKSKPKAFVRSYYRTMNKLCALALVNGMKESFVFNKATIDTTTGDGLPLFSTRHPYHTDEHKGEVQSNLFSFNDTSYTDNAELFEKILSITANKIRNVRDENGEVMGYTADTIIIPGNRPIFEAIVKKVVGSERSAGTNNNDINIQFGNWNVVVLNEWNTTEDQFMIMSSAANKALLGNLFFNRIPLTVKSWIDNHTSNYIWNGRCRFGVGFGTWKHILLCVPGEDYTDIEE